LQKGGQFPDEPVRIKRSTNSLCNLPDVLPLPDRKEISLGGLLLKGAIFSASETTRLKSPPNPLG
jgi:hypothetical protein